MFHHCELKKNNSFLGSLKDQLNQVNLKSSQSSATPNNKMAQLKHFNFTQTFGKENVPKMMNAHGLLQDELKDAMK